MWILTSVSGHIIWHSKREHNVWASGSIPVVSWNAGEVPNGWWGRSSVSKQSMHLAQDVVSDRYYKI